MLPSKEAVPLRHSPLLSTLTYHLIFADLSLDFAAWQTIVRCVAFYHSLLSERSFSIGLPYGHPNPLTLKDATFTPHEA